MALKTFNIDEETYAQYSKHCKEHGISMSKQVERFIAHELTRLKEKEITPDAGKNSSDGLHPMKKFC